MQHFLVLFVVLLTCHFECAVRSVYFEFVLFLYDYDGSQSQYFPELNILRTGCVWHVWQQENDFFKITVEPHSRYLKWNAIELPVSARVLSKESTL